MLKSSHWAAFGVCRCPILHRAAIHRFLVLYKVLLAKPEARRNAVYSQMQSAELGSRRRRYATKLSPDNNVRDHMSQNEGFYCPTSVDVIHSLLRQGIKKENSVLSHGYAFVRNIAYNLQYLEYLNYVLSETDLHVTVRTLTQKTFVITGMSIVEAILWFVLKSTGQQRKDAWEITTEVETTAFEDQGSKYKILNIISKQRPEPVDVEMTLDAMIKRVESKKLLGLDGQVYRDLNYLRKLRNRVHIHAVQHDKDTDWYSFNNREVELMRGVLGSVLCSELFAPDEDQALLISYLKASEPTSKIAEEIQ